MDELWWKDYYFRNPEKVISLTALGYKAKGEIELPCDVLGRRVEIGDVVVTNSESNLYIGKVVKITPKRFRILFESSGSFFEELKSYDNILVVKEHNN